MLGNFSKNTYLPKWDILPKHHHSSQRMPQIKPISPLQTHPWILSVLFHVLVSFPEIPYPYSAGPSYSCPPPKLLTRFRGYTWETWILPLGFEPKSMELRLNLISTIASLDDPGDIFSCSVAQFLHLYERDHNSSCFIGLSGRLIELIGIKWFH